MSVPSQQGSRQTYKRRRVTLACKVCRHRKTRCNGGRPRCASCIELGLTCSYDQPEDSNGVGNDNQPSWELRLASIENTIKSLVETVTQTGVATISTPQSTAPAETSKDSTHTATTTKGQLDLQVDYETIHSADEDDEEDVTDGMASVAGDMAQTRRFFGPSSIIAFLRTASLASIELLGTDEHQLRPPASLSDGSFVPPKTPSATTTCRKRRYSQVLDPYTLPPLDRVTQLIDLFFNTTGMLFPYIDEAYVRTQLNRIKSHGPRNSSRSFLCLLNALLAMTVHVEYPVRTGQYPSLSNLDPEVLFNQALGLLGRSPRCSVVRVQSLLMLCQYRQGTQNAEELCALHAEAVGISRELGLHTQVQLPGVSPVEQQIRRRTWMTCIMMDKVLSMTFGQPQLIAIESAQWSSAEEVDLSVDAHTHLEGEEQSRSTSDLTICYFATAKLYVLLGEILSAMYADNTDAKPEFDLSELIQRNISIERQLILWRTRLPTGLSMRPWMETTEQQSEGEQFGTISSTILYLRYLNVSILKDRPILLWFLKGGHIPETDTSAMASVDLYFADIARVILGQIETKAREVISITWSMSNRLQTLGAWWFSTYYILNSCLVIFSCLLVQVRTAKSVNSARLDIDKVLAVEDSLQKGLEATSKIFKSYRKPDRIQGTLDRLLILARAVSTEVRSSNDRSTRIVTQYSTNFHPTGVQSSNSYLNLGTNGRGIPQPGPSNTHAHNWPVSNNDTNRFSTCSVDDSSLQNLLWDNWGIANDWSDMDLGFEDIITF